MRICVFGAGAIGGHMAVELADAGADVTVIARGPHLQAIRANGLKLLLEGGGEKVARLRATDDPAEAGPHDYVIVTLKAHSLPPVVDTLKPLFGEGTALVTGMNGVPYWYFHKLGGPLEGSRVEAVDPGGVIWNGIGPERAIGCVVYTAAEVIEPGVVGNISGNRLPVGEPDGSRSDRVVAFAGMLQKAGFRAPVRPRIRDDIWVKLWGNLSFNPLSALTHATLETLATDPGTRAVARAMMVEGQAVGEALGIKFPIDVDRRIDGAAEVGAHRTSMLQDLERGRPMEIDALVTAVSELGAKVGVATPTIDMILALVRQRAREAGCY
jgi:2-dehydropantoate 2-reductase